MGWKKEENEKEGQNKNTKWENSREKYGTKHMKKRLLESERNSTAFEGPKYARNIAFLLVF